MNNIARLNADLDAARAEINALRDGLFDLSAYLSSAKFRTGEPGTAGAGYVNTSDIITRLYDAGNAGRDARETALYNTLGPKPEPSYDGWRCPICRAPLQDAPIWNDTDARAAARMLAHWTGTHKPGRITDHAYHAGYSQSDAPGAVCLFRPDGLARCDQDESAHARTD